ncbi:MAG: hypothetical protein IJA36_07965 [Lachnospiraceae bacterium]|nr:hypothetical protein [Lachnospiraceae bacterium]
MHSIQYSRGIKATAIILQTVFVVVMTVGLSVCFGYQGTTQGTGDMLEGKAFIDSAYYESLVEEKLYDLSEYVHMCSVFETDGGYDPEKLIDIESYVKRNVVESFVTEDEECICYHLEDLIKWSKEGLSYGSIELTEEETEKINAMEEDGIEYTKVLESMPEAIENTDSKVIHSNTQMESDGETVVYLDEYYLPVDGISLADRFYSDRERQQFYVYLENAIVKIAADFEQYKIYESKFNLNNTNLHYAVVDVENSQIYTNEQEIKATFESGEPMQLENLAQDLKRYGTYYFMNSVSMGYDSSLKLENDRFLEIMRKWNNVLTGNYYIAAAVDNNFIVKDNFYMEKVQYEKIQPWYRIACISGMISCAVAFMLFVYITFVSGHVDSADKVRLNWFDHIKTELAACIMFAIGFLEVMVIQAASVDYEFGLWNNVIVGVETFVVNLSFMAGYLSLVRRIKAGKLWENSILHVITSFISKVFRNRKNTTRTIILFGIYVALNGVSIIYGVWYGDIFIGAGVPLVISIIAGVYVIKDAIERHEILDGVSKIVEGDLNYKINLENLHQDNFNLAQSINNIGSGLRTAVEESTRNERMKTELITNVSHDIKTPLTSIINYVGLIKREKIENERIQGYVEVLENKAQRLKHLTEDLVEASKISSGNIELQIGRINLVELIYQTAGEFGEKFDGKNLNLVLNIPNTPVVVMADGRRVWRVIENLYNNVAKYALNGTRVYADLNVTEEKAVFSLKNISENQLNFKADELTERFIRGDVSRSTEGSGLGLSIAKNLTELQGGEFEIYLDGDLFRVTVSLPLAAEIAEDITAELSE